MLIADCGSAWTKIYNTDKSGKLEIFPTKDILTNERWTFDIATGHASKKRTKLKINELTALARGALAEIKLADFTVVDVGARDTKMISFRDSKLYRLDWNTSCASSTGIATEMLAMFYNLDFSTIAPSEKYISITCGVFGIEKVLDMITSGESIEEAAARFIHGLAKNTWNFADKPKKLFLSGGFCENTCFVQTLGKYCDLVIMGRDLLIKGLIETMGKQS